MRRVRVVRLFLDPGIGAAAVWGGRTFERMDAPVFTNEFELARWLVRHGAPVSRYGTGSAKTVGHLLAELQRGECILYVSDGIPCRRIVGVWIDVICERDGRWWKLAEDRQEFKDGRVRRRRLDSSCGEKLLPGEDPLAAGLRALAEELGIDEAVELVFVRTETHVAPSTSYPGLRSHFETTRYKLVLPASLYRVEYVEEQQDKRSVFLWREL